MSRSWSSTRRGSRMVSTMARASAAVSGMAANGLSTVRLDIKRGQQARISLKAAAIDGMPRPASHCMVSRQGEDASLRKGSRPASRVSDTKSRAIFAVAFNSKASLISAIVRLLNRHWRPQKYFRAVGYRASRGGGLCPIRSGGRSPWKAGFRSTLLHPSSLEKTGLGGVLPDVGGVALLSGVDFTLVCGRILVHLGVVTRALVTAVGRRHWRHFVVARHEISVVIVVTLPNGRCRLFRRKPRSICRTRHFR